MELVPHSSKRGIIPANAIAGYEAYNAELRQENVQLRKRNAELEERIAQLSQQARQQDAGATQIAAPCHSGFVDTRALGSTNCVSCDNSLACRRWRDRFALCDLQRGPDEGTSQLVLEPPR